MNKVGSYLKSTREQQGLSLEEMSKRTKIHIYKLTAIEKGDRSLLPAKVFAIGLIKSYARELKIENKVIDDLCREAFEDPNLGNIDSNTRLPNNDEPADSQAIGRFQIPKIFVGFFGFLLSIVLGVIIYFFVSKMNSYSKEETLVQSDDTFMTQTQTPVKSTNEIQREEKDQQIKLEKEPIQKNKEKAKDNNSKNQNDLKITDKKEPPTEKENFSKPPDNEAEESIEDNGFADDLVDEEKPPSNIVQSDNKLVVKALEGVEIKIIWSDGFVQPLLLKEGESKTLVFTAPITIKINNGGAVNINFNQKDLGVPGALNEPIELKLP